MKLATSSRAAATEPSRSFSVEARIEASAIRDKKQAVFIDDFKKLAFEQHHSAVTLPRAERLRAALLRQIGRASSLLDVGAGDGTVAKSVGEAAGAERIEGVDVILRPHRVIDVRKYDGLTLPYENRSFEVVTISDVLHHCEDARRVLCEALRVASRVVVIKDHFAYGPISRQVLYLMDVVGNARDGIPSPAKYLEPHEWVSMIESAGGRLTALEWPVVLHDWPWRLVASPALHFIAKVEPRAS